MLTYKDRKTHINFQNTAVPTVDFVLGTLADARISTLLYIREVSDDELYWRYADGWNSIAALLEHFSTSQQYFRIKWLEKRELTDQEAEQYKAGMYLGEHVATMGGKTVEQLKNELASGQTQLFDAIKKLSHEEMSEIQEGYHEETGCNLAWILHHVAEDEVHHRGQISIIRKLYKAHVST